MKTGALFVVTLFMVSLAQPADALVKRSKKDECTVCHVMWMDAFFTDELTLLGPTQNNIVIDGSNGLSSSKRMCYSCHDGYVKDSRTAIALDNKHHQLKKVPDWLELKANFRLDINNEIYCGTCHGFHDVRNMGEVGSTPFMRMDNSRSEMCMACHTNKSAQQGHTNHPLFKKSYFVPSDIIEKLGGKLGPEGEIICQSCHVSHKNPALLASLKGAEICLICHQDKKSVLQSDHNLSISRPEMKNTHNKDVSQAGPCSSCHVPHNGNGRWMWARTKDRGNPAAQACLSCHRKELKIKQTGTHSHPLGVKPIKDTGLPLFSDSGQREKTGRLQCPSCHNVHQWNPAGQEGYVENMEGGAQNSFLRVPNQSSALCTTCHKENKELYGTDHDLRITAPSRSNKLGLQASVSGPCGACHIPHNASGPKLWAGKPLTGNPASAMCLSCHGRMNKDIKKTVGQFSHPVGVRPGQKSGIKAGLPFFAEYGNNDPAGQVQCATCHNPHRWNPDLNSKKQNKNSEGDPSNSFLRIGNTNQSALCRKCHTDKAQVVGSDHNLQITAPAEKNLLGKTAAQSGPCGSCHVVHNAATKMLWAKKLVGEKGHTSQLCASCHRENGAAEKKQTGANSHPVDVAIDRVRPARELKDLLPLAVSGANNPSGTMVVCTTCHDPHRWAPGKTSLPQKTADLINREGDGTSSFLRRPTYPASDLCRTCHENQAPVVGTLHDLTGKAPEELNLQGQSARETGPCGVCHLVHNSPNSTKLWARSYGPIRANENKTTSLCTSCHSPGNIAAAKVQEIYTHPEGILTSFKGQFKHVVYEGSKYPELKAGTQAKERYTPILINNAFGFLSNLNYTPLFNDGGKKVNVGKISCPSCHNVHKWRLTPEVSTVQHMDVLGSKFLRTESYHTICIECHGPDGLYRYLYFHSPRSRTKIK
jgi:predicted CXXCH cytochrome family protein